MDKKLKDLVSRCRKWMNTSPAYAGESSFAKALFKAKIKNALDVLKTGDEKTIKVTYEDLLRYAPAEE